MVICLEQVADLHIAQLMPLPLTVSCFSKVQIGFTFLVPADLGSPGKRAVKRVCVVTFSCELFMESFYINLDLFFTLLVVLCTLDCNAWLALPLALCCVFVSCVRTLWINCSSMYICACTVHLVQAIDADIFVRLSL